MPDTDVDVDEGWYDGKIVRIKDGNSSQKGTPYWRFTMQVTAGEFQGQTVDKSFWMTEGALNAGFKNSPNFTTTLKGLGVPLDSYKINIEDTVDEQGDEAAWATVTGWKPERLINKSVKFRVRHRESEDGEQVYVEAEEIRPKGWDVPASVKGEFGAGKKGSPMSGLLPK